MVVGTVRSLSSVVSRGSDQREAWMGLETSGEERRNRAQHASKDLPDEEGKRPNVRELPQHLPAEEEEERAGGAVRGVDDADGYGSPSEPKEQVLGVCDRHGAEHEGKDDIWENVAESAIKSMINIRFTAKSR